MVSFFGENINDGQKCIHTQRKLLHNENVHHQWRQLTLSYWMMDTFRGRRNGFTAAYKNAGLKREGLCCHGLNKVLLGFTTSIWGNIELQLHSTNKSLS